MNTLYKRLKEAFTNENLTKICSQLLLLYQSKQYDRLRCLLKLVDGTETKFLSDRQLLSKLMKLYHPDLLSSYTTILEARDVNGYMEIAHILKIQESGDLLNPIVGKSDDFDDYGEMFSAESKLEYDEDEMGDDEEDQDDYRDWYDGSENNLFNVFKTAVYGRRDIELPLYLLEDIDELELSNRGIDSLEGVEHFQQLERLDISQNVLSDLNGLEKLIFLEELYANDNEIGYIDSLTELSRLRVLVLANNKIDDISILLQLEHIEFVDLTNNSIPVLQIEMLKQKGVLVIY
ncbi:MAG: leucine-rich repeat domain-containing protein [Sphingobacterium sp.]